MDGFEDQSHRERVETVDKESVTLTRSPYEILRVNRWADLELIKAHYYHLVKEYNPEYHEEEFIEVRAAFDILRDPQKRAAFDIENFVPPPPLLYSEYPDFPGQPLSLFKLNQELKAICGDRYPEDLEGEERSEALRVLRGMVLYHAHHGNLEEAEKIADSILTLNPEDEETRDNQIYFGWKRAWDAIEGGDYAEAERQFERLAERNVYPGLVYQNLALARERQGKKEEAGEAWRETLRHMKEALKSSPEDKYLQALTVAIHKYTGGKFLEGASAQHEGGSAKDLGLACVRQGNWKQAVGALERARTEHPDDIDVLCQLGWAYLNTNQHNKAFHMWNSALKKAPGRRSVLEHLVRGHVIFGKRLKDQRIFNQALVQFKNALKYEPANAELRLQLADTYFQMRNFYAAVQEYEKILEMEPRNKDARQGIREAKRLGGFR